MKKLVIIIAMAIAGSYGTLHAQKPAIVISDKTGWHKIGETTASFDKDHDEVDVLLADNFAALKFRVLDAPIELMDLDIIFEDGTQQNVKIGYSIKKAGDSSNEIDIKGAGEKKIDKIMFHYRTLPNRKEKKAHVEMWGKKTNVDAGDKSEKKAAKSDKKENH